MASSDDASNGDDNKPFNINEPPEPFQPCFMCNGFYGPCYEDPICPICHLFLLTNANTDKTNSVHKIYQTCLPEEKDDEDSGNDEPVEDNDRSENSANDPVVPVPENNQDVPTRVGTIEQLPPEVMMLALGYLDDLSMWAAASVNHRWREIITQRVTTPDYWQNMVILRWPLFKFGDNAKIKDWFEVYSSLAKSSCCFKCLRHMAFCKPDERQTSWCKRRLSNELKSLRTDPPDGIQAQPIDKQYCHWMASVQGPVGSPYEGGIFFLYLYVSLDYPMIPPIVRFITKIYHPNISRHGDIGLDCIGNNWSLALTISKVLISIQSLLTDPASEICMEPKIGEIYANDRVRYDDTARIWTWRYAMTHLLPH